MIDLRNRAILITGASSGIGRQCAITCSELGASVALVGRNAARLAETQSLLAKGTHCVVEQDLTAYEALGPAVSKVVEQLGPISGFVHSAGIQLTQPLAVMTAAKYAELFAINVVSGFELARIICRKEHLAAGRASLVFIASIMGLVARPGLTAYCASKGALIAGIRSMALELARKEVTVNCISPGMILTPLMQEHLDTLSEAQRTERKQLYPLGPGQPGDVAGACAFLLSQQARWITGTNLVIDGGYSAQ
jgi:NAD(P)-dependent dehydrogenase (short-subunit alcohol dehydrogenase family)